MIHLSYTYKAFPLEKRIYKLYKALRINKPEDIDEIRIAKELSIFLTYSNNRSYSHENGRFQIINIDKNLDEVQQREVFFHELCHLLRHSGYQYKIMPDSFRDLQEWDANHFTRYAAIPFHMLWLLDWKSPSLVKDMSKMFKVSEEVCQYRVDHVHRNAKLKSNTYTLTMDRGEEQHEQSSHVFEEVKSRY